TPREEQFGFQRQRRENTGQPQTRPPGSPSRLPSASSGQAQGKAALRKNPAGNGASAAKAALLVNGLMSRLKPRPPSLISVRRRTSEDRRAGWKPALRKNPAGE